MDGERTELIVTEDVETIPNVTNPLDLPVEIFQKGLDRRGANRTALMKWVASALVEGVDYGRIKIKGTLSKPSLWKAGAEKICGMLGVTVTFPSLHKYEEAAYSGIEIKHIILRCELVDGTGNVVATGTGSRVLAQEHGDINKAIKMAEKSGHIDATLRLAGLSEVFTQDIEDMKLDDRTDGPGRPNLSAPPDWKGDGSDIWPFGKHEGKAMSDIPTSYLSWCAQNMEAGPAGWAEQEINRRDANGQQDMVEAGKKKGRAITKIGQMESQALERGLGDDNNIDEWRELYAGNKSLAECPLDGDKSLASYGKALKKLLEDAA